MSNFTQDTPSEDGWMAREMPLYGPAAAVVLAPLFQIFNEHADEISKRLFDNLMRLPRSPHFFQMLSADELEQTQRRQLQYLLRLASPTLSAHDHGVMARQIGRIHAAIGLDRSDLARSPGALWASIRNFITPDTHHGALEVLERRFIRDLALQLDVYQNLQTSRETMLLSLTEVAWKAPTYTDLITQVVETLSDCDEIAGCFVGRPDDVGIFRYESIGGAAMGQYLSELEKSADGAIMANSDSPKGNGPTGRAWRSGNIERSLNISTDPHMTPWEEAARRVGFRSSVAIPLHQPDHPTRAILTLYSASPGAFTASDRVAFTSLLQSLLGFAITRLEALEGKTQTMSHGLRQHFAGLLRGNALVMHYQPLMDLHSGQIVKVEALARLLDGDQLIRPDAFLPAFSAEDLFELYRLGLEQALTDRQRWAEAGHDLGISLNLPATALGDGRYYLATRDALHRHACAGEKLTLEVLEYDAFPLGVDPLIVLSHFKALGVVLAEDDLGSGHSSLNRLREIPFDDVKIDRHTARVGHHNPERVLLFIHQLIQLGHTLLKRVTVEGIEDFDMLEAIAVLGADLVQGYVISQPMSAEQLDQWLRQPRKAPDRTRPVTAYGVLAMDILKRERQRLLAHENQRVAPD